MAIGLFPRCLAFKCIKTKLEGDPMGTPFSVSIRPPKGGIRGISFLLFFFFFCFISFCSVFLCWFLFVF